MFQTKIDKRTLKLQAFGAKSWNILRLRSVRRDTVIVQWRCDSDQDGPTLTAHLATSSFDESFRYSSLWFAYKTLESSIDRTLCSCERGSLVGM